MKFKKYVLYVYVCVYNSYEVRQSYLQPFVQNAKLGCNA
jgi:hypothetical protein